MNSVRRALGGVSLVIAAGLNACGGADPANTDSGGEVRLNTASERTPVLADTPAVLADASSGFVCHSEAVTCVEVVSTGVGEQPAAPVTFGQPFRAGDLTAQQSLVARNAAGQPLPMQMDAVSTRPDGSVRFAVLTVHLSKLQAQERRVVNFFRVDRPPAAAAARSSASSYDLDVQATVYHPQTSLLRLGNRDGVKAGTPFLEGEKLTLSLSGVAKETYELTVTADMAGGGFPTLSKIAWAFKALIDANPGSRYKALKQGEGGGYELLWLTTKEPDGGAFEVSLGYTGQATHTVQQLTAFQAPELLQVFAGKALRAAVSARAPLHLQGDLAQEYTLVLPFADAQGAPHPQLTARLHVRLLDGGNRARTDMVIENNWAYNPNPGNIVYQLRATQNGQTVLSQPTLTHNHHARWHQVLWQGQPVQAQVRHHMPYFMASRVVWNYNLQVVVPEKVLAEEATRLAGANTAPMGSAFITPYFGTTGGRAEIGPYPRWTALYLLSQDPRAMASMMANANAAGSVPIHYRDAATDHPLDLDRHPGATVRFGASSKADALPAVVDGSTNWSPDTAHQASFAFVPYLVTGDQFYLDEMMFWAAWNMVGTNPGYRGLEQGLIHADQVRGQAWALRAIGEAARALPDTHAMKAYYEKRLANNLQWYTQNYPQNPDPKAVSPLGYMESNVNSIGPWQNDFLALVFAQLLDDGYEQAGPYLEWLSRFTVGRFLHEQDAGYCTAFAPEYYIKARRADGSLVQTWRELVQVQDSWGGKACTPDLPIMGYPDWVGGYAANARAMLAATANAGIGAAGPAYQAWAYRVRAQDAGFGADPTWAIVPHAPVK